MKILLLGSGALKIGQAGEFDYSGSQAIKALKEENIEVILINPNIATIQTSEDFAHKVYFLPLEPYFVAEVIKKEKPQGIMLSFGGQTALNCGLALAQKGIFKKYNVSVLGTSVETIKKTEDRALFAKTLSKIGLSIPKSLAAVNVQSAKDAALKIGYPVMIRGGFSLGGQDSGVASSEKQLVEIAQKALAKTSQILIEEYLNKWKEVEYEVVRDRFDNCITVCNMENFDPMGIHTGESIVVAPSQTLNNFEYHKLREIAISAVRHLKIVGECNIQFALNPKPETQNQKPKTPNPLDYRIIEVNARLSRSSALASKATGYPLAYVAAKLALGFSMIELKNSVTKKTIACFEPALDYVVVKIPRWDLGKFAKSEAQIGSYMQSVGEVMAIGRKFEEALQKAVRMLDLGLEGILDEKTPKADYKTPTPWRLFSISQAIKNKASISKIYELTGIDPFFLFKIKKIAEVEKEIEKTNYQKLSNDLLKKAKQLGFSDRRIASLAKVDEEKISKLRQKFKISPVVKQIDTLAAEYPARTNYLYLTYNGEVDDLSFGKNLKKKIVVLGSGPYRIGSSVEFDWCSVSCAQTVASAGNQTIIINCNPETVSTDYDMANRLYFEELSLETILEIYHKEKPQGVIISMGGQTPNNLALKLAKSRLKILGTAPTSIDCAEDRNKFSKLCDALDISQPVWAKLTNLTSALSFAKKAGYPVLVRPSYVLSGTAMNVAFNASDLKEYLLAASRISEEYPVVISQFHQNAKELEIDAVANEGKLITYAITEHVENAGVHSGDSTIVFPAQKLYLETVKQVELIAQKIAKSLKITGPFNIQFLAENNKVKVIECNLRASRSFPFVSKVTGVNFAKLATEAILNKRSLAANQKHDPSTQLRTGGSSGRDPASAQSQYGPHKEHGQTSLRRALAGRKRLTGPANNFSYVAVKSPQFSFSRIKGADPILRVEMASTGEVACFGDDVYEAFLKSLISTGVALPKKSVFISLAGEENKIKFLDSARILAGLGLKIFATAGTAKFLNDHGVKAQKLFKIHEHKKPNVLNFLNTKKIDLVINIFDPYFKKEFDDDYLIRRTTIDFGIPLLTNLQTAELFVKAISIKKVSDLKILPWSHYVRSPD